MPATGGVSLIRSGVLFARLLAVDGFTLRQTLVPLIELLSAAPIPRTWMI
jgi:urease accessory protein